MRVKWFREHFAHPCSEDLPFVDCPVFVATGSKDVQVPPEDAARIASLCGGHKTGQAESPKTGEAESYVVPDMTHILRKDETAEGAVAILKGYKQAGTRDIDPQLLSLLRAWLERFSRI